MRSHLLLKAFIATILFILSSAFIYGQSTGVINRPTTSVITNAGRTVLDPNDNGYTSLTTAGFGSDDVTNSEIPYRSVPSFSVEPFGDLRRGPSHLYSDFVPDANNVGYYAYYDGTNLLFRFRVGSIMPGSKGYSVLLDTDGKFGATGTNADPNYQPATTGTNGNPGFEIEIVLETNSRIAIYNVDGSSSATLVKSYVSPLPVWTDMSQISIAGTFDNGDPDFFIDFYIPFSDLTAAPFSITNTTPLRMSATTVMSSQAAIGGPKSDIYGLNDAGYKGTNEQYEAYINAQPPFTATGLITGGFGSMCTAAPMLNTPISTGATSVSGTWAASPLTGAIASATIKIYKDGIYTGNSVTTSGGTWTVTGLTALLANQVITAKAVAIGESECLSSNSVIVSSCNSSNRPATPTGFCGDRKGFAASSYPAGATINLYRMTSAGLVLANAAGVLGTNGYTTDGAGGWTLSGGCSTGGGSFDGGTYMLYYTLGGCDSKTVLVCANNNQASWSTVTTTPPVITNTGLYTSTSAISGTAVSGSTVRIFIDDILVASPSLTGTSWSYTFTTPLSLGQVVKVTAQQPDNATSKTYYCAGSTSITVTCYTTPPLINVDNNSQITIGQPITGTSSEPTGTTIRVYTSPGNSLIATTTVQSNGTWSTGNVGTLPATYNAAVGSYYATAQNGTCGVSTASGNATAATATTGRCGTITGPVNSSDVSVSGTLTGSVTPTTVNLYLDDILIGTTSTNNTAWTISVSNLFNNGVLKIGVREGTNQEEICTSSATTITCSSGPVAPVFTPTNSSISEGQTQTYTINNAVAGAFYGISNASTGASIGTGVWATSSTVNLTTTNLTTNNYTVAIKGTSLNQVSMCSSAPVNASLLVSSVLPLDLIDFTAKKRSSGVLLEWITENETGTKRFEIERSSNGINYTKLGEKAANNVRTKATYTFFDEQPQSVNYYRLKMIDEDGKFNYSKVLVINQNSAFYSAIQPNPFVQSFSVNTFLPSVQPLKIQLLDLSGRLIRYKSLTGIAGTNKIEFNDVSNLQPGVYMVRIIRLNSVTEQKIIKTNP